MPKQTLETETPLTGAVIQAKPLEMSLPDPMSKSWIAQHLPKIFAKYHIDDGKAGIYGGANVPTVTTAMLEIHRHATKDGHQWDGATLNDSFVITNAMMYLVNLSIAAGRLDALRSGMSGDEMGAFADKVFGIDREKPALESGEGKRIKIPRINLGHALLRSMTNIHTLRSYLTMMGIMTDEFNAESRLGRLIQLQYATLSDPMRMEATLSMLNSTAEVSNTNIHTRHLTTGALSYLNRMSFFSLDDMKALNRAFTAAERNSNAPFHSAALRMDADTAGLYLQELLRSGGSISGHVVTGALGFITEFASVGLSNLMSEGGSAWGNVQRGWDQMIQNARDNRNRSNGHK